jgi:hypothetical protein
MTVKVRFDGHVFVPDRPVDLPVGFEVEIPIAPQQQPTSPPKAPLMRLVELLDQFPSDPDWPEDAAAQHDHYLYGAPKRDAPL